MLTDVIKLTAAALYGTKIQEFDSITRDSDLFDTVRFLSALSVKMKCMEDGTVYIEPMLVLPKPGSLISFDGISKKNALFFLGLATNLGLIFKFTNLKNGNITYEEAKQMSECVGGILQFGPAENGFIAASANYTETNGCMAKKPFEFTAGLLLTMPLCGKKAKFRMGENEGNELIETAYERLVRYSLVTKREKDTVYVKCVRHERLVRRRRKAGRPRKIPKETEKA